MFFFYSYGAHRDLHVLTHSFPPRRSSDLAGQIVDLGIALGAGEAAAQRLRFVLALAHLVLGVARAFEHHLGDVGEVRDRSEEHTSELQSLMRISYAVFCLQKKKRRSTPSKFSDNQSHNTT